MKNSLYCFLIIALAIPFLTSCVEKEKPGIAVYKVTQSGATRESAEKLIKLLPIWSYRNHRYKPAFIRANKNPGQRKE